MAACYEPWMEQYFAPMRLAELLLSLGFSEAASTARQEGELRALGRRPVISSRCPVVNALICERYPQILPFLAKRKTPAELFAAEKKAVSPKTLVVSITTCPAQKPGDGLDAVLPLEELLDWLREGGTQLELPPTLCLPEERTFREPLFRVEGLEACEQLLRTGLSKGLPSGILELSACPGGCAAAPGVPGHPTVLRIVPAAGEKPPMEQLPSRELYRKKLLSGKRTNAPSTEAMLAAYTTLGTLSPTDRADCGQCGFPTCEAAARAVCDDRLPRERCPYRQRRYHQALCKALLEHFPAGVYLLRTDRTPIYVNAQGKQYLRLSRRGMTLERAVRQTLNQGELEQALSGKPGEGVTVSVRGSNLLQQSRLLPEQGLLLSVLATCDGQDFAEEDRRSFKQQTARISQQVLERQREMVQQLCTVLGEAAAQNESDLIWLKEYTFHA